MPKPSPFQVQGLSKDKKSGQFRIDLRYRDPETRTFRRYHVRLPPGTTLAAAKVRARQDLNDALTGKLAERSKAPPIRLRKAFDDYLAWARTNRPRTAKDRTLHAKALVVSLGDVVLDRVSPFDVERFKRDRKKLGNKDATINRHLATLKHMFGWAEEHGLVPMATAASVRRVRNLKEGAGRVRFLSDDEQASLFGKLDKDPLLRPLVVAALLTGLRLGELVRLQWGDVSFDSNTVVVRQSKTDRSRGVPLHARLREQLESVEREKRDGAVFRRKSGRAWTVQEASRRFHAIVVEAKVKDFRFHDLRHTYATRIRASGGGIDEVARLLGHTSLAVTQRYAHLEDARLHQLVSTLAARDVNPAVQQSEEDAPAASANAERPHLALVASS